MKEFLFNVDLDSNVNIRVESKVLIRKLDLSPFTKFEYRISPKETQYAYLKARFENKSNFLILAGPANVFLDRNFIGTTQLENCCINEVSTFLLGIDKSINVIYKPIEEHKKEKGTFRKKKIIEYIQNIEIINGKRIGVKNLLVSDQLENDKGINIKLVSSHVLVNTEKIKINAKLRKSNQFESFLDIDGSNRIELIIKFCKK